MRAAVLLLLLASCGGGTAGKPIGQCGHAAGVGTGVPGACAAARASLSCESAAGGCGCLSDDDHCPDCAIACVNNCHANEYAVSCGGPPNPGFTYDEPPAGCRVALVFPSGGSHLCCPCL